MMTATDPLSATFAAVADPTRRAILTRLSTGERTVTELAEPFDMTLPSISKHLKVLEQAGLVVRGRDAQWRPRRLRAEPLKAATVWLEQYRKLWEERLGNLEAYLAELQRTEGTQGTEGAQKVRRRVGARVREHVDAWPRHGDRAQDRQRKRKRNGQGK